MILDNDGNDFSGDITIGAGATLQLGDGVGDQDVIGLENNIANSGSLILNEESGGETLGRCDQWLRLHHPEFCGR